MRRKEQLLFYLFSGSNEIAAHSKNYQPIHALFVQPSLATPPHSGRQILLVGAVPPFPVHGLRLRCALSFLHLPWHGRSQPLCEPSQVRERRSVARSILG